MQIFKLTIVLFLTITCVIPGFSQDKIYMGIGTRVGKITDIGESSIKFNDSKLKGTPSIVSIKDVFLLFNDKGGFLVPFRLDFNNSTGTKKAIGSFLNPPPVSRQSDYLYMIDSKVMKGIISKENKKSISIVVEGNKLDVEKSRVVAVIYKDGHHNLISPPVTAADILWSVYEQDEKAEIAEKAVKASYVKPDVSKNEPAPVKPDVKKEPTPVEPVLTEKIINKEDTAAKNKAVTKSNNDSVSAPPPLKFEDVAGKVSKEEFEKKALQKTRQLNEYLKVLCSKSTGYEERNKAIDLALTLFVNDKVIVETSSLNRNDVRRFKIRDYLSRIKLVNYDKVEIEWTKLQYVSDLKKAPDGNYYGTVSFEQVFRGYIDGKIVYQDITLKQGQVVLKTFEKMADGITSTQWEVLLSDIGVISTKSL